MANAGHGFTEGAQRVEREQEVDLLGLLAVLWNGKWLALGVIALGALVAFVLLSIIPSLYRIETTLNSTSLYHLQGLQPSILPKGEIYQVAPLEGETMYRTALAHAGSQYVQRLFWEADRNITPVPGASLAESDPGFRKFVQGLEVDQPGLGENVSKLSQIALYMDDPRVGVDLLDRYIQFVDDYTVRQFINQLRAAYETSLGKLDQDKDALYRRETLNVQDELTRLNEAFALAETLNIRDIPYEQVQNIELSLMDERIYLLGTSALGAEIGALQERLKKPLAAFVPRLREMEHWQGQMQADLRMLENKDPHARSFVIVSPPESSIFPVKPNKPLLFALAVLISALLGCTLVFARQAVKSYRLRPQAPASEAGPTQG
ncbi:hypothetical protein F6455_05420 [Proteobacteria bacterium 005FR1]|nr:hypothetical protein [Proteobacteria bacterium 005FR1]